ncbi:MAG: ribosome maturation factor RimM [Gemmatimonadota bacterium]
MTPAGERPAQDPDFVVVGHFSKPHGTKGELFVWPLTDRAETTFAPGVRLYVSDPKGELPDPEFAPVRTSSVRPFRRGFLILFEGIADREAAEVLRDRYLLRPFDEIEPLAEGELFYHQLLGMTVVTTDGEEVGRVREVYALRPADLLAVEGPNGEHLIPFTREIVSGWELEEGKLVINPPAGLLDL